MGITKESVDSAENVKESVDSAKESTDARLGDERRAREVSGGGGWTRPNTEVHHVASEVAGSARCRSDATVHARRRVIDVTIRCDARALASTKRADARRAAFASAVRDVVTSALAHLCLVMSASHLLLL